MKKVLTVPLYIAAAVIIMVLAAVYIYSFTTLPETELNGWIGFLASKNVGVDISFQRINRDIWNRLVIEGIEVHSKTAGRQLLGYVSRLEIDYSIANLVRGQYSLDALIIDSLYVRIPDGGFKLVSGANKGAPKPSALAVSVHRIFARSAEITLPNNETILLDSLESSLALNKGNIQVTLDKLIADWPSRDLKIVALTGRVTSDQNGFQIASIDCRTNRSRVLVSGRVGGKPLLKNLSLEYTFDPIDLDDIRNLTGVKINGLLSANGSFKGAFNDFEGNAVVDGRFMDRPFEHVQLSYSFANKRLNFRTIDGRIFRADFKGTGQIDFAARPEEYAYDGTVRHLDLTEIGPKLNTDFTGSVHLRGAGFNDKTFHMSLTSDLDSVSVDKYYFDQVSGPVEFDLKRIQFLPGFKGRYKHTYVDASGSLEYLGNLDISGGVEFHDLTDFTGQIFLQQLGGEGTARVRATGSVTDFDVKASFESDSCWTYGLFPGRVGITANLETFVTHPVGIVMADWIGGALYSMPTDSGYLHASVAGNRVFLDSLQVNAPVGHLTMTGDYDGTTAPPVFKSDTLYGEVIGNRLYSLKPIKLNLYKEENEFAQFLLGFETGTIQASGTMTNDLGLSLNIKASGFQIEPFIGRVYKDKSVSGIWSGTAELRGNFAKPVINFDLAIDSLALNKAPLGRLEAQAKYEDGYLHMTSGRIFSQFGEYLFTGNLPMNLSFEEVKNRFPNDPIDFKMTASGNRLLLSEIFIPNVERFETVFSTEMSLTGTYAQPLLQGQGTLTHGQLKIIDLVNPLTNVRAYLRMQNEMIYIDSVFASTAGMESEWAKFFGGLLSEQKTQKTSANLRASGTMKLLTLGNFEYNISVNGRNFYFLSDAYDVRGLCDTDLQVQGRGVPTVGGEITLKRLEVRDEFSKFVAPGYDTSLVIEDSTLWDLNLDITAANNIWIQNSEVDAEFKGDVLVQRRVGILKILGSLDELRGSYTIPGIKKFTFVNGSLIFNNVSTVNPNIDFTVSTRLATPAGLTGARAYSNAELHITGTLLQPKIGVGSASEVTSMDDILRFLIQGSDINPFALAAQNQSGFSQTLLQSYRTLSSFIPDPLTSWGLVQEFEIAPTEQGLAQISVARYISRSLYVRYSQMLSQQSGRTVGAEYFFNDNVSFHVSRGVQGSPNDPNQGISFDLNLNFEY